MNSDEDDFMTRQRLSELEHQLVSAASILHGEHLIELKRIIAKVANICQLKSTDTGTFVKPEDVE
jgi:hypothetical protein